MRASPLVMMAFFLLSSCGSGGEASSLSSSALSSSEPEASTSLLDSVSSSEESSASSSEAGSSSAEVSSESSVSSSSSSENEPLEPLSVIALEMKSTYGDSFLIKQGDYEILVDAGTASDASTVQAALDTYVEDDVLDLLILTHFHTDHIGKMTDASFFGDISVNAIVDPGVVYSSSAARSFAAMRDGLVANGSRYYPVYDLLYGSDPGPRWEIEGHGGLTIEFFDTGFVKEPGTSYGGDQNNTSLAFTLEYGETRWLFAGDLPGSREADLVKSIKEEDPSYFAASSFNVFKACHHGSDGSNTDELLSFVEPDLVFMMAGLEKRNRTSSGIVDEQHPYLGALERFRLYTEEVYWTSINGTTTMTSEGRVVALEMAGRTQDYYYEGEKVDREAERFSTVYQSKYYLAIQSLA